MLKAWLTVYFYESREKKAEILLLFNLLTNNSSCNSGQEHWAIQFGRLNSWERIEKKNGGLMGLLEIQIWQSSKLLAISVDFFGWKALADDHKSIIVNLFSPTVQRLDLNSKGLVSMNRGYHKQLGKLFSQ